MYFSRPKDGAMKITLNVDCTPEEARAFFGLPDLKPLQSELLDQLKDRLSKNIQSLDPETIARNWFSPLKAFEQMQELFLSRIKSPPEK
jgi:hypothetical protein